VSGRTGRLRFDGFDPAGVQTPAFVVDRAALRGNLEILAQVKRRAGCGMLLALKGFALWRLFPDMREFLDGVCASGPIEARLGREEFGGKVHSYSPAYSEADLREVLELSDHVSFNSFSQWRRFRPLTKTWAGRVSFGLRVNPEQREAEVELYDPSAPGSRLGMTAAAFEQAVAEAGSAGAALDGISGLHFHNLCEQNADSLERTLAAFEKKFGRWLSGLSWVNFGGGHHITRDDYDRERLVRLILDFRRRHPGIEVILEPGEAVAFNAGLLVASMLDVVHNNIDIAILDVSATAHMPDVLEMPYRPRVWNKPAAALAAGGPTEAVDWMSRPAFGRELAGRPRERPHDFRLGGVSCLAGDVIGDWSFDLQLEVGDRLVFEDMAHYTMVKTTTFNGVRLPSIVIYDSETGSCETVREFGYADFKSRLS
jgi:carboxynorspermidine decarboxylase